jgi:uncharacterized protein YciI
VACYAFVRRRHIGAARAGKAFIRNGPGVPFTLNANYKDGVVEYNEAEAYEFAASMDRAIYYVYLLKKGPTWSPDSTPEIDALQEAHLGNLRRLAEEGKLVLNGPLLDSFQLSGEIRGIGVLKAKSLAEAREWISTDPMVKVGRLVFELHAWMVPKGILP